MYETFVQPLENFTTNLLDRVADALGGEATDLRRATEHKSVNLPDDLYAHRNVQTEWWYYTGHCETVSGNGGNGGGRFGFELVFFKRRTDLDRLGLLPLRLLANPLYAAHFAVSGLDEKHFRYEHRKSFNRSFDLPARADEESYFLRLGDWNIREDEGSHLLHASLKDGLTFDAALRSAKPAVLNGDGGGGISFKDEGEASSHFSFTRMSVEGEIKRRGAAEKFTGSAWMDREFGTWCQKSWDWFSVQLDDDTELMIYQFRNELGEPTHFSHGAFVDKFGKYTHLNHGEFRLEPVGFWQSPATGTIYPSGWVMRVPRFDIELKIEPILKNQELDTRGTTMIVYWEGACEVAGRRAGVNIKGLAYAELVGYDRSHENPSLRKFLSDLPIKKRWKRILNDRSLI